MHRPAFGFGFGFGAAPYPSVTSEPVVPFVRTGNSEETISQKRRKENIPVKWSPTLKPSEFDVKLEHLKEPVAPLHEELPLTDVDSKELLDILQNTPITSDELNNWKAYGDYNIFQKKEDMVKHLTTVITYCETDHTAGPGIKNKLRLVTKVLKEEVEPRAGILIMLSQHGNVCNVMKEVAVNLAYSMLANNVKEYLEKQALRSLVLRQLQILRELLVEEQFISSGNFMNTHPLIAYRNGLSQYIGLDPIPDQHAAPNPADNAKVQTFYKAYSTERIVKAISNAMNDKNRKIPYNTVVEWLQQNSPVDDPYEFLQECFDQNGSLTPATILFVLHKMNIIE